MFFVGSYLGIVRDLIQRLCGIEMILLREMERRIARWCIDVMHLCKGYSTLYKIGRRERGNAESLSLCFAGKNIEKEKLAYLGFSLEQN